MKGLILAAGKGTRLRPLTYTTPKPLLPIANKPTLLYAVEALLEAEVTDVGIVVGSQGEQIASYLGDGSALGANITYICQDEPLGLAHAVMCAEHFIKRDSFLLYLGDTLYDTKFSSFKRRFDSRRPDALVLVSPVDEPSRYGIAELEGDRVIGLEEKPVNPKSNLAMAGIYFFGPAIWDVLPKLQPSNRGELEITDAVQLLVERGAHIEGFIYQEWWQDSGTPDFLLSANDYWLRRTKEVPIGAGSILDNVILHDPYIIGTNCKLQNCVIGPNVSLGNNSSLQDVIISNSIVGENCIIENQKSINNAIIGKNVKINSGELYTLIGDETIIANAQKLTE